jgi:hypothetical protein
MKPLKHAEVIKAWADGAKIQWYDSSPREHRWKDCPDVFLWQDRFEFRVKPEPKPDVVLIRQISLIHPECAGFPEGLVSVGAWSNQNVKLTFDGETNELKAIEML